MKKIISAFLACAVMALSLAGCGGSASSSAPAAGSASSAGGSTAGTATTVSWWMDPQNMASNQVKSFSEHKGWQLYEKNVGVDIDWQEPASGQSAEQFNLIVATSDLPDIMYYSWATSYPGGPDAAIADGKIVALNDYIEEYAPNFSAYLDAHPDVRQEITTDSGNIYCFPGVYTYTSQDSDVWQDTIDREPYEESFIGLVVRKDLLDKAGLDIPVTLDDWYEALVAFKDMGIKYPLSCQAMMLTMAQCFSSAYDITVPVVGYDIGNTAFALKDDGSIFYGPAQDSYKEYLAFMNKLYSEGLLDPDFMVQDRTNVQSKVINGEVGAWVEMMPTGLGNLRRQVLADDPNSEFYPVGVLNPVLEEGQQLVYKQGNAAYIGSGAAITTSCEDIATACKIIATGHSRGGKVALCAAIYDERIALCAPNGSGCGGAGCFRFLGGRYGEGIGLCETAGSINDMLGYWWTDAFGEFGARQKRYTRSNFPVAKNQMEFMANFSLDKLGTLQDEDRLPFDMHFAKALIAPRALITTDGLGDVWANTFGTQVTWRAAQEVFDFLGVPEKNALHFREGKHEFQAADWIAIVDFCDEMFFGKTSANNIVSFRPVQQAGTPMDVMMERMDWRKTKLHYTWSNPLEDM